MSRSRIGDPALVGPEGDLLDVLDRLDVAPAAHHDLATGELEQAALDVVVGAAHALHHLLDGDPERGHAVGVEIDLVLFDEPPHAGDLGHPGHAGQGVAHEPVLDGAQRGQVVAAGVVHQGIGEHPADPGGVRADDRCHGRRQLACDLLEVLDHPRPRPVDVGPVLEDRVDVGEAEVGEAAYGLDLGGGDQCRDDGVGHLVLDEVRAAAFPGGVDDDLHVREVGNSVERYALDAVDPPEGQQGHRQEHDEPVAAAEADGALDHGWSFNMNTLRIAGPATVSPGLDLSSGGRRGRRRTCPRRLP